MKKYDYLSAVKEDVMSWIDEHNDWKSDYTDESGQWLRDDNRDEIEQDLNDRLFGDDSVTGNASGSYTFNTWQAEKTFATILTYLLRLYASLVMI